MKTHTRLIRLTRLRPRYLGPSLLLALVASTAVHAQCRITTSTGDPWLYALALAVEGDVLLAGSPAGSLGTQEAAFVYRFDGASWNEEQAFVSDWGARVAIDGERIMVGTGFGADLYVYNAQSEEWDFEQHLTTAVTGDIALFGDVAVAGGRFVFRHDGNSWVEEQELVFSGDLTNHRIAMDAERIVIGLPYEDGECSGQPNCTDSGVVYVFRHDTTEWVEEQRLTASDAEEIDRFGSMVAIDGERIVVGASQADVTIDDDGVVYVFERPGVTWIQQHIVPSPAPVFNGLFGASMQLEGDRLLVGQPATFPDSSAHMLEFDGASWNSTATYEQVRINGEFSTYAIAVAFDADRVFISDPTDTFIEGEDPYHNYGAIYVYGCEPRRECAAGEVNTGCDAAVDILTINGQSGGIERTLEVTPSTALDFAIVEPPAMIGDGEPTRTCLYAFVGAPAFGDVVRVPRQLGTMCYGPFIIATQSPARIWNSIGKDSKLGPDNAPGAPPLIADSTSLSWLTLPGGVGTSITVTIQGVIEDSCSRGTVPLSITNGITLVVE